MTVSYCLALDALTSRLRASARSTWSIRSFGGSHFGSAALALGHRRSCLRELALRVEAPEVIKLRIRHGRTLQWIRRRRPVRIEGAQSRDLSVEPAGVPLASKISQRGLVDQRRAWFCGRRGLGRLQHGSRRRLVRGRLIRRRGRQGEVARPPQMMACQTIAAQRIAMRDTLATGAAVLINTQGGAARSPRGPASAKSMGSRRWDLASSSRPELVCDRGCSHRCRNYSIPRVSMLLSGRPSARLATSGDFSSPRHAAANGSRLDWSPIPARIRQRGTRTASYPSRASNPGAGAGEASCKEIQFEGNFAGPNRAARMRSRRSSIARSNRPQARDGTGPGRPRISNRTWVQTGA
jgi:hypothetical protein